MPSSSYPSYLALYESGVLARRAEEAVRALASCEVCPRNCRVDRLKDPRAHSQHPRSSCQHVLQRPVVEGDGTGDDADGGGAPGDMTVVLRTPFIYVESRGEEQLLLAGCYRHELVRRLQSWVIRLKRVDLLNPSRALPAVQLFI